MMKIFDYIDKYFEYLNLSSKERRIEMLVILDKIIKNDKKIINVFDRRKIGISDEEWESALNEFKNTLKARMI